MIITLVPIYYYSCYYHYLLVVDVLFERHHLIPQMQDSTIDYCMFGTIHLIHVQCCKLDRNDYAMMSLCVCTLQMMMNLIVVAVVKYDYNNYNCHHYQYVSEHVRFDYQPLLFSCYYFD